MFVPFPSVLPSTELALAAAALRCGVGGARSAAHADPASRERGGIRGESGEADEADEAGGGWAGWPSYPVDTSMTLNLRRALTLPLSH